MDDWMAKRLMASGKKQMSITICTKMQEDKVFTTHLPCVGSDKAGTEYPQWL